MNRTTLVSLSLLLTFCFTLTREATAGCKDRWDPNGDESYTGNACINGSTATFTKTVHWKIYWLDGYSRAVNITDSGQTNNLWPFGCVACWPGPNLH